MSRNINGFSQGDILFRPSDGKYFFIIDIVGNRFTVLFNTSYGIFDRLLYSIKGDFIKVFEIYFDEEDDEISFRALDIRSEHLIDCRRLSIHDEKYKKISKELYDSLEIFNLREKIKMKSREDVY